MPPSEKATGRVPRGDMDGPRTREALDITQRRTHHVTSPHTCQNGHHQKVSRWQVRGGRGARGTLCPVGNGTWCGRCGGQCGNASKKLKTEPPQDPTPHCQVRLRADGGQRLEEMPAPPHPSQQPRHGAPRGHGKGPAIRDATEGVVLREIGHFHVLAGARSRWWSRGQGQPGGLLVRL